MIVIMIHRRFKNFTISLVINLL